jgi:hypothetical protein
LRLDTKRQELGVYKGTNSGFIDNQMLLQQRVVIEMTVSSESGVKDFLSWLGVTISLSVFLSFISADVLFSMDSLS